MIRNCLFVGLRQQKRPQSLTIVAMTVLSKYPLQVGKRKAPCFLGKGPKGKVTNHEDKNADQPKLMLHD